MSFYGKKSLIWWSYDVSRDASIRYAHSSEEIQLKILEKWYPIGTKIQVYNSLSNNFSKSIFTIKEYVKTGWGWAIVYDNLDLAKSQINHPINPHRCRVLEDDLKRIKREHKINRIL